jgi:AcrR family transcriptional regulator
VTPPPAAPKAPTARARARAEITAEIKAAAHRQLGEVGAAGLSLRAVAREVGMVSSAVYRYVSSRDALLTALIIDAFDAVGTAAEQAEASTADQPLEARWVAVTGAVRAWAKAAPEDYALVYGSPVPGYEAPRDTVDPAARVSLAALRLVADGLERGEVDPAPTVPVPPPVAEDLTRLRVLAAPGVPDEVLARILFVWMATFGTISYELFGHLHGAIESYDEFFEHEMRRAAAFLAGHH